MHAETELADTQQALYEAQQRMLVVSQHYNAACVQLDQQAQVRWHKFLLGTIRWS